MSAADGDSSPKSKVDAASPSPKVEDSVIERSEFVVVSDSSGEIMELPTNSDNTVFISTLQNAINPQATGLKYKNPKTGASRAVVVDPSGAKLIPPSDGWDDKVFNIIVPVSTPARGADVSVKRRKMGDSDGEDDGEIESGRLGRKRLLESSRPPPMLERRPIDLIVLGVSFKTTDDAFKTYFEQYGTVAFAEIKRSADGTSKGFGFVQMATVDEQDKVVDVQQHMIDGRRCDVKVPDQRSDGNPSARHVRTSKIFVGRLTDKIDDTMLREFFEKEAKKITESAQVTDVFIPRPFRGFAFVTFSQSDVADKICRMNNFVIDGTSVGVSLAVPRDEVQHQQPNNQGFYNDYGYSYGYGKGGAGYGAYPGAGYGKQDFGYASPGQPNGYGRGEYDNSWVAPPSGSTPARMQHPPSQWMVPPRRPPAASSPGYPPPLASTSVPPPIHFQKQDSGLHSVGNQIATGLDALNLNQKNPELLSAAWNAFFSTLNSGGGVPPAPIGPPQWPPS